MADSSSQGPKPPVRRLDRASLERVLARASELQAAASGESPEEFSEDQLIELGKEVGLSAQNLRQALAEEQTRSIAPVEEHGMVAGLFGPSRVQASRIVPGRAADVLATIDVWMQRQELLIVKRHHAERIVWEPRHDFFVGIKRALKVGGRDYALSHSYETAATVVQIDDGRVQVALDADLRTYRRNSAGMVAGMSSIGAAAAGALFVMGVMVPIVVAPLVVMPAVGVAGARSMQARLISRAQLALEQLLDRLERGEIGRRGADSILGAIVAAATAPLPPRKL